MSDAAMVTTNGAAVARAEAFSFVPRDLAEAMKYAEMLAASSMIPTQYRGKPADVLVAVQMGHEIGIGPTQALAGIAVVNGRASIWGDLGKALVLSSGKLAGQTVEWDEATQTATVTMLRVGVPTPFVGTFSMERARKAKLAGKDTYQSWGQEMITWRAWWRAARDGFSDVLKGISAAEEQSDVVYQQGNVQVLAQAQPMMPRRLTTTEPDPAAFMRGETSGGTQATAPRSASSDTAARGILASCDTKTSAKGRTFYVVKLDTGEEFTTFDAKTPDACDELQGQPVEIEFVEKEQGGKVYRNLVALRVAEPDEPGADG